MWAAFEAKDATFDGRFFVAVRTTGVYCRPSCAARPHRKNVVFFETADAAEAAGFRACKRCHPRDERLPAQLMAARVTAFVSENGHARLDDLSAALHVSPFHLQRTFKQVMGVTPAQYARSARGSRLNHALRDSDSVTDAIYAAGFGSGSQVYGDSAMPPGAYRQGGRGQQIDFIVSDSALGRMLVAATGRGLCAVYFGDDDRALIGSLHTEYPNAQIAASSSDSLIAWAQAIIRFLDKREHHHVLRDLPLDVQGTAFQAQVWQALRTIPEGETRSYAQLAAAIGRPTAMRAVANACGANRVAVVIPCHRIVREGGATGGYRWGVERKAALLARERLG
jgi:AraC family transcriptional regulator, regulatory protein of adaptative response / methylated-DNA-[protein]-cysteine methyltransferase